MRMHAQQLTVQFYEWECLGRGWLYADEVIELEPQFTPFFGHRLTSSPPVRDDGVHHTFLSRAASLFKQKRAPLPAIEAPTVSYDPYIFQDTSAVVAFRLHIPKGYHASLQETLAFLVMLSYCKSPVSVEYLATHHSITMQLSCREQYVAYLKAQLRTHFPGIILSSAIDLTEFVKDEYSLAVTDFGLGEEFMRPLAFATGTGMDSLTGVFSILDHLKEDERVIIQVLCNGLVNRWEESMLRSVSDNKQGPFFENAPEMIPMTKEKIGAPLLAVTLRLLTQANSREDAAALLEKLCFAVCQSSRSGGNSLIPLPFESYTIDQRVTDIVFRESHRTGMLLNVKELATFAHIPSVQSKKLISKQRRTKAAPETLPKNGVCLGINDHEGKTEDIWITDEQRLKHTHVIGATGTGKSTLLRSMIVQDIEKGNGVAVLDPHGDLIETILTAIPKRRVHDVIIVDLGDTEYPVGFNILHAHSDIEKEVLSSDLVSIFRRNSTSWGDQMNSVFANAVIAFLESSKGGTLADLRRFLVDKGFREAFLKTVADPSVQYYWQKEYSLFKTNSVGPILTRLDTFLRPKLIRNMVCQDKGLLFEDILNSRKILLVKLSQGLIGEANSYLLGSFVVAKIHQAALARQAMQQRNNFFFYIDEFQHFVTPSMIGILSGARKYHVGMILAHQDMQQLQRLDPEIAGSVVANAGARVCFRVGDADAKRLADGLSYFESQDLQNLDTGEAIARIERPEYDFSLTIKKYDLQPHSEDVQNAIIANSRHSYAAHRSSVEEALSKSLFIGPEAQKEEQPTAGVQTEQVEEPTKVQPKENRQSVTALPENASAQRQIPVVEAEIATQLKEGTQHRYLQTLIKKMAESRGYRATIEALTPDGNGKVDVLLEKENKTIACEVSVTTDAAWEIHNIQKCLAAGYDFIVSCMADKRGIPLLQKKVQDSFSADELGRINVFEPEALFNYLDTAIVANTPAISKKTYKGYRVNVSYDSLSDQEMKRKRESVAKIVVESLKKQRNK